VSDEPVAIAPPIVDDADEHRLRIWRENDRLILVIALAVILAAALLRVTPDQDGVSVMGLRLPEVCAAKRMGTTCPGCGLTRSFTLAVKGDARAFELHPLGPLLLAFVVFQVPFRSFHMLRSRRLLALGRREELLRRREWPVFMPVIVLLVTLVVVWLLRNWL
jgi:hypothetical protein